MPEFPFDTTVGLCDLFFTMACGGNLKLMRTLISISLGIVCLLAAGCIETHKMVLGPQYPPSSRVEVLKEKPSMPYQQIALLKAVGSVPEGQLVGKLVEQAKAVGADAIILLPMEQSVGSGGNLFPMAKALAIKYGPAP